MIGIVDIASYLPSDSIDNYSRTEQFGVTKEFIKDKTGIVRVTRKDADQETSDLCCAAFENLCERRQIDLESIQAIVVCTQNPDFNLPHTAAIVHGKLGLSEDCAAFDISLGCSGFVYGLSVLESFMESNGLEHGLLFTADPYSKVIDENDKNTSLLFGDGAAVTYVSNAPVYTSGRFTFGTRGKDHDLLICRDGVLSMNGRAIFNFAASTVPKDVRKALEINGLTLDDIDYFLLHQGSKYIVDYLTKKLQLPVDKAPFVAANYGNTVSSSIPFMLQESLANEEHKRILITGFGVGLSWSSTVLQRT